MYFIDVQGTLISDSDKSPIDGSIAFIEHLNKNKIPYMIITNNTKKASKLFFDSLVKKGFDIDFNSYLDPLMILEEQVPKEAVAAYGSDEFLELLVKLGYSLDYQKPKSVLIAIKEDFNANEYAQMIDFLLNGSKLVGMHETSIYAKNSKRYPGVGAILKMLEFATSVNYEVVGKPSVAFYTLALEKIKAKSFSEITIISDDVKGDLGGAKELGMRTIFVTSGKYKTKEEILPLLKPHLRPDETYASLKEVLERL